MVLGPTTYAFAATLAAVIAGAAVGSWAGTWLVGRARRPAAPLALLLATAAIVTGVTYSLAGGPLPYFVAERIRDTPAASAAWAQSGAWLTAALVVPTAACLGAAFTLGLAVAGATSATASRRFGAVYAANTVGSVSGSLAAGFLLIPWLGLQGTLQVAGAALVAAALAVAIWGDVSSRARSAGVAAALAAVAVLAFAPPWDRALLAGGGYLYAPFVPSDLDLGAMLRAGTLQFYDEGAAATIAVKRLTGTTTLTVDGKTDASNRGDMLTQKLAAHLPLLLHDAPREVAIVGLGSGVTVGAALTHPITAVDVIELSPEVVAASWHFAVGESPRPRRSAHPAHRRRRPVAPAAVAPSLRRDRLRAVEPMDRRRRHALHPRVLRRGTRPTGARRRAVPMGQRLQHRRRGPARHRRDVPGRSFPAAPPGSSASTTCCWWAPSTRPARPPPT